MTLCYGQVISFGSVSNGLYMSCERDYSMYCDKRIPGDFEQFKMKGGTDKTPVSFGAIVTFLTHQGRFMNVNQHGVVCVEIAPTTTFRLCDPANPSNQGTIQSKQPVHITVDNGTCLGVDTNNRVLVDLESTFKPTKSDLFFIREESVEPPPYSPETVKPNYQNQNVPPPQQSLPNQPQQQQQPPRYAPHPQQQPPQQIYPTIPQQTVLMRGPPPPQQVIYTAPPPVLIQTGHQHILLQQPTMVPYGHQVVHVVHQPVIQQPMHVVHQQVVQQRPMVVQQNVPRYLSFERTRVPNTNDTVINVAIRREQDELKFLTQINTTQPSFQVLDTNKQFVASVIKKDKVYDLVLGDKHIGVCEVAVTGESYHLRYNKTLERCTFEAKGEFNKAMKITMGGQQVATVNYDGNFYRGQFNLEQPHMFHMILMCLIMFSERYRRRIKKK
jgi:hypothetical protein